MLVEGSSYISVLQKILQKCQFDVTFFDFGVGYFGERIVIFQVLTQLGLPGQLFKLLKILRQSTYLVRNFGLKVDSINSQACATIKVLLLNSFYVGAIVLDHFCVLLVLLGKLVVRFFEVWTVK